MKKYLHLDCEMGGLDLQHSLLTAYFLVTDTDFNKIDELYLRLCPNDGNYFISSLAMEKNKIDIIEHDKIATPYKKAGTILYEFLQKNGLKEKPIPVGQGIRGDLRFIWNYLVSRFTWETFVSYRYVDVRSLCIFLQACGKISPEVTGGLKSMVEYFGIEPDIPELDWHDAKYDTYMAMRVYQKMLELVK